MVQYGAVAFGLAAAWLAARWLDAAGFPGGAPAATRRGSLMVQLLALQFLAAAWLAALWLGLSARPVFAGVAGLVTLGVFVVISRQKHAYLREPLVFSDLAFLPLLWRHPALFYLGRGEAVGLAALAAGLVALIAAWIHVEPRLFGYGAQAALLASSLAVAAAFAIGAGRLVPLVPALVAVVTRAPAGAFVQRLGLTGSLLAGYIAWRTEAMRPAAGAAHGPLGDRHQAVIVLQSESFADLRRHGLALELAAYDRLRARALAHGRLDVSCFGAYTHRSEFETLTGVPFAHQGMDRFHPYLRPQRLAGHSLARQLAGAGWRAVFAHPHDARFFGRDAAIPALGFDRFIGEGEFGAADRFGPYVGDVALGRRIGAEIAQARQDGVPLFMMAVTMEAHDPYGPGRLDGVDDPARQYARHLANADAMLAGVADALDRLTECSLLVFYGDHAPILPGYAVLADDTATDYIVVECGRAAASCGDLRSAGRSSARSPAGLNALLRDRLGRGASTGTVPRAGMEAARSGSPIAAMSSSTVAK